MHYALVGSRTLDCLLQSDSARMNEGGAKKAASTRKWHALEGGAKKAASKPGVLVETQGKN